MRSALFVMALVVASAVGCKGTESTGNKVEGAGGYFLFSVNGATVPTVTLQNESIKQEILSGSFFIGTDKTFNETRIGRITLTGGTPSQVTSTQSGTWTREGTQFTFTTGTPTAPIVFVGTVSSNILTFVSSGTTFKYQLTLPD